MTNEKAFKFSIRDDTVFQIIGEDVPEGNIEITENGTGIDVAQYATAIVNVAPSATITVTDDVGVTITGSDNISVSGNTITVSGDGTISITSS